MIKLHLKDGGVIESESKDANFVECTCATASCGNCPFGGQCGTEFSKLTFGEAMEERRKQIRDVVAYTEDTDDCDEEQEGSKKKYTFEFTDEQAMYLHAFMNLWEQDDIQATLDAIEFFDKQAPPFVTKDYTRIPKEWRDEDEYRIVHILHAISYEIFSKLNEQREFGE